MRRHELISGVAFALATSLFSPSSHAIVTQVDGQVLPNLTTMQAGLDTGEGATGVLNSVFDAATSPEVFQIPIDKGVYRKITFADIREGAGYESTFGWYNVSDPSKIYAVLTCTPTNYEPGQSIDVDFQAEFTAGRYKGGFIGFFLISPNGEASNCGNPANLISSTTPFIVYTESSLNSDGNYVHYLTYESKNYPLTYYFGFEDLWRGGDNDFEDMLIRVTGLQKPCVPSPEICDGKDNNCDGEVDNNPVDANTVCGSSVGECQAGKLVCVSGSLQCQGSVGSSPELCDKKDNDCDGTVDNNPTDINTPCGSSQGECKQGSTSCIAGVIVCSNAKGPAPEVCDNKDNDCNGKIDDSPIDAIGACAATGSTCPGVRACEAGKITCQQSNPGGAEICNGADDNCNGLIDEGDPGAGADCVPDGAKLDNNGKPFGLCLLGKQHCIGGSLKCTGGRGPAAEVCDGLDNDCDGVGDQKAACPGESACLQGKCATPCKGGEFPCPGGQSCVGGYCIEPDAGVDSGKDGSSDSGHSDSSTDSGHSDSSADSGSAGSGGKNDASLDSSVNGDSSTPQEADKNYGMSTGSGACSVGAAPGVERGLASLILGILASIGLVRRSSRFGRKA